MKEELYINIHAASGFEVFVLWISFLEKTFNQAIFFERLTPTWLLIKSAHCSIHPSLIDAVHQKKT